MADFPAPAEGIVLAHFLVSDDRPTLTACASWTWTGLVEMDRVR